MAVTVVAPVTSSRSTWGCPCSKWGEEMADVKAREGGTEIGIPSDAKEEEGSSVCWAITDRERVQMSLWLKAETRDLRQAIVRGDE